MTSSQAHYWLMKSEPDVFSFTDLKKAKKTSWEGVRNFKARNFIRAMQEGDLVLFYHSNSVDKGVIGLAKIISKTYPDPIALDKKSEYYDPRCTPARNLWSTIDVAWYQDFERLVSLDEIRATPSLENMILVKKGNRLSVFPVTEAEFNIIAKKGATMAPSNLASVGQKAPTFKLKDQDGNFIALESFKAKKNVVLYFYPKALTPGCTTQACGIRDAGDSFDAVDTVVLGVSPDPVELIKKFQEKHQLNFPLLSDLGHKVAEEYGVWGEKNTFGKLVQGLRRISFIIGKDGTIKHVMPKVDTKTHHDDVLSFIKANLV